VLVLDRIALHRLKEGRRTRWDLLDLVVVVVQRLQGVPLVVEVAVVDEVLEALHKMLEVDDLTEEVDHKLQAVWPMTGVVGRR